MFFFFFFQIINDEVVCDVNVKKKNHLSGLEACLLHTPHVDFVHEVDCWHTFEGCHDKVAHQRLSGEPNVSRCETVQIHYSIFLAALSACPRGGRHCLQIQSQKITNQAASTQECPTLPVANTSPIGWSVPCILEVTRFEYPQRHQLSWPKSSIVTPVECLASILSGHDRFLSNYFQFIRYSLTSFHSTISYSEALAKLLNKLQRDSSVSVQRYRDFTHFMIMVLYTNSLLF